MALLIDLIVGAAGDFLGGLGNDLLKDAQKRAAFAKCLGAALEVVKARYAELVYAKFLDNTFFEQETVTKEFAKLLSRSGEPDVEALFEQYRREWQPPRVSSWINVTEIVFTQMTKVDVFTAQAE
jgi:hypothetical protein